MGMKQMNKPGRPLGLSIAIVVSVMLFSLLPLVQTIFVITLREQFRSIEFLSEGGAIGGDLLGFSDPQLILPVLAGLVFLLIAVLAWRGRPKIIRGVFALAVLLITALTIGLALASLNIEPTLAQGIDSGEALVDSLLRARVVVSLLVAVYVMWYVNRGPARAFYRGYFLPDPTTSNREMASSDVPLMT